MSTTYTAVDRNEFETFLADVAVFEDVTDEMHGVSERVYDLPLPDDDLTIRVFSTISTRSDSGRGCGEDAIRTVIWDSEVDAPVGGKTKTLRIGPSESNSRGWAGNLEPKIRELYADWRDYRHTCSECESKMALRDGQYGEFYGCTNYPRCENTMDVDE